MIPRLILLLLALLPNPAGAEIEQRVDSMAFSVHTDVAWQMDEHVLRAHLENARLLFESSEWSGDVPCCTDLDSTQLTIFGDPNDGLDVIDSEARWNQLGSRKAFVWDISWCGTPGLYSGCATLSGDRVAVALSVGQGVLPNVIAHERGHNAGLPHNDIRPCNLMNTIVGTGCLDVAECNAFRTLGSLAATCTCMGAAVGDPPLPDGTQCITQQDREGLCQDDGVCVEGTAVPYQKISSTQGGFSGPLLNADEFGQALAWLTDLDGDGVDDMAVGARYDDDGGWSRGAVWVLFLTADGTVKSHQKISSTQGGFTGFLDDSDEFGFSLAGLGDLDGDGLDDLAVGAVKDDDGGSNRGALWLLFLNADGTVKSHQKISSTQGGLTATLDSGDWFGSSVTRLGDLDGDGLEDLAVGAQKDDDGGTDRGAVWILFLDSDGSVKSHQKISGAEGGFTGPLGDADGFGAALAWIGDLDGDGAEDLAVGAPGEDQGGWNTGAVWILFLDSDGSVKSHQQISDIRGGFAGTLDEDDAFGSSLAWIHDVDGNGVDDLAVGAPADDDGGWNRGAIWILLLASDGTVQSHQKISATQLRFSGVLQDGDGFGSSVTSLGNLGGAGMGDLAVGASTDDDGGFDRGASWVLFVDGAFCGDGVVDGGEQCDGGNAVAGDGCDGICQIEVVDQWAFSGIAQGGTISCEVAGVALEIVTLSGETTTQVALKVAAAINDDPALSALGIGALTDGSTVLAGGIIASRVINDWGLSQLPPTIPGLPFPALCLLALLLLAGARRAYQPRP